MNRRKSLSVGILCAVTAGALYFFPLSNQTPEMSRSHHVTYYSDDLNFSGVKALPELQEDPTVWVWSVYNKEAISFYVEKEDSETFQLMFANLNNPEIFYQLCIHPKSDEVNAYKYVGGIWTVDGKLVRRSSLRRVVWNEIGMINFSTTEKTVSITIPWSAIKGITTSDRIGIQIIEGSGDSIAWDSRDDRTSFLDRRTWNELRVER